VASRAVRRPVVRRRVPATPVVGQGYGREAYVSEQAYGADQAYGAEQPQPYPGETYPPEPGYPEDDGYRDAQGRLPGQRRYQPALPIDAPRRRRR
jgi:hypothetical protein